MSTTVKKLEYCVAYINQWMSANRLKLNPEKTELRWSGYNCSLCKLEGRGPAIKLGSDTIEASGNVSVLWVILSSDFSVEKHVSAVNAACFFHLRQIRRVRQSLDAGSAKTLVQAFVTSRVDYCNAVLAESPRVITDKLQRMTNSAARVISNARSSTAVCRVYCVKSSTGSMSPIEYDSSSQCSCIDASMELLRRTWWTVVR